MFELTLIGIGTGNPDHLTQEGVKAIRAADLILIPRKGTGKDDLATLRQKIIAQATGDKPPRIAFFDMPERRETGGYLQGVEDWHRRIAQLWQDAIAAAPAAADTPRNVALLIWGDPSLYDSSLRIAAQVQPRPRTRVIPGITALQALTAAHAMPLNDIGAPVLVTTGRRLRDEGWPAGVNSVAVMLDGQCSFKALDPEGIAIWWGAFLGMPEQVLISGTLDRAGARIIETRAKARAEHGWIMDIYLLKKPAYMAPQS